MDHLDGNHHNNTLSNLKTFCAICHIRKRREVEISMQVEISVSSGDFSSIFTIIVYKLIEMFFVKFI